ncbi:ABC transporter permease subunit [Timonella senegalensis]|uniref:ABC transporter permease subunit n=3 Tax=Timonella senegalensis TaxID=1465825 RepID=UPI0028A71362|nr:ABC transporter permease subunit [Timonella senegalensis]
MSISRGAAEHDSGAGTGTKAPIVDASPARNFKPGFVAKIILMACINAFGLYGLLAAWSTGTWGVFAGLVIALIAANYVYFSRRAIPGKYLYPGLLFLFTYQLFTMAYTGYVAFTNYGDGHNSDKGDAIEQILSYNESRVEGSAAYPVTVVKDGDGNLGFAIVQDGVAKVGTAEKPLEDASGAQIEGNSVKGVEGFTVLPFAQIVENQQEITNLRVPFSDNAEDGSLRTQDAMNAYQFRSTLEFDKATDTMTDTATGDVYTANGETGFFTNADGKSLTPGWRVSVGFDNFTYMFTDSRVSGPFFSILTWTFAFAFLSVATTFALGLFFALVFNDPRVRGRKFYRAILILPYAFPGFLSALVWKGMLNERFGFVNEVLLGGNGVQWLSDPWIAKFSILMVNLWLGFPYMFLITTGALQSLPGDVMESAKIDGASPWRVLRSIILPLLMISTAPLLISSFAFNFNNFSLIYMLTGGGPNFTGSPLLIGSTDILISMVYSVAFESGVKQYGLASAVSILIFIMVGVISWLGFRQTRKLEEY